MVKNKAYKKRIVRIVLMLTIGLISLYFLLISFLGFFVYKFKIGKEFGYVILQSVDKTKKAVSYIGIDKLNEMSQKSRQRATYLNQTNTQN